MTSSTSGSDPPTAPEDAARTAWRRWLVTFCGAFFGAGALLFALLLLIDPYDTGRFPSFGIAGITDNSLRTADASRGRDPRFNAAVIGNSTGERLNPYRLSKGTGLRFIQISIPGTGPREQLVLMKFVLSHHPTYGALVIVTDPQWCSPDPEMPLANPFPFWLYGGDLDYLANVLSAKALDRAVWRILIALGLRKPVDPVGYSDYLIGGRRPGFAPPPPGPPEDMGEVQSHPELPAQLPWVDRLSAALAEVDQSVRVVPVMPPVYYTALPQPGSRQAEMIDACKTALRQVVAHRPGSGFLDFRVDLAGAHDSQDFLDAVHYRDKLERQIEDAIIAELQTEAIGSRSDEVDDIAHATLGDLQPKGRSP